MSSTWVVLDGVRFEVEYEFEKGDSSVGIEDGVSISAVTVCSFTANLWPLLEPYGDEICYAAWKDFKGGDE